MDRGVEKNEDEGGSSCCCCLWNLRIYSMELLKIVIIIDS